MSQYAKEIRSFLASRKQEADDTAGDEQQPEQAPEQVIHVYHTTNGGIVLSSVELDEEEEEQPRIVDTPQPTQRTGKAPPLFLLFCLLLGLFLLLDVANAQLLALMTPTVTISITPTVKTLTLSSSTTQGKQLLPITLSQSLTVPTTGHGHQNATRSTGILTWYNGLATVQSIPVGTVLTGQDGVQVVTDASITIAANNPPNDGVAQVSAHALQIGSNGNIAAGDINTTLSVGVYVRNLTAFTGGRESRDFQVVTPADEEQAAATLQTKVTVSMSAALQGQLMPGQELQRTPCTPQTTANHQLGEEAATLQVTVSETCTAIAYDIQLLQARAMQLLNTQARAIVGTGYNRYGIITVTVIKAFMHNQTVVLSFTAQGTWMFHVNVAHIQALVSGKPRLTALQLLTHLSGIARVSISGIPDNQELPTDPAHIRLLLIYLPF